MCVFVKNECNNKKFLASLLNSTFCMTFDFRSMTGNDESKYVPLDLNINFQYRSSNIFHTQLFGKTFTYHSLYWEIWITIEDTTLLKGGSDINYLTKVDYIKPLNSDFFSFYTWFYINLFYFPLFFVLFV